MQVVADTTTLSQDRTQLPRRIAAALGEFWLAGTCLFVASRTLAGAAQDETFGLQLSIAYEFLGLMVLRFFLLGQESRAALTESRFGLFTRMFKLVSFLFTGVLLWFQLIIALIALPFLVVIDPWLGLFSTALFLRHVYWGYRYRPKTPEQTIAAREHWTLTRRVSWIAFGASGLTAILVSARMGVDADGSTGASLQIAAAGLYFLILGIFRLRRDPRLVRLEAPTEQDRAGARPDVVY